MHVFRILALLLIAGLAGAQDGKSEAKPPRGGPPPVKTALNRAFKGRITKIKKRRVTIYYDFEDPAQLDDFEEARPPRLLDASQNRVRIQGGRLLLEGSSAIRHKMEGQGEFRARYWVRPSQQSNIGSVFTEPILSDFYVVLNLFDQRFYQNGAMILAACGLHEDEGADTDMSLVNWRDIITGVNLEDIAKVGSDVEVEHIKDGWTEMCRVGDMRLRKGSSKGKCKDMKAYKFGLWVHHSRASFDDLTLELELTDEYLDLNDLRAVIDQDWEEVPTTGPLAGISGVPPRVKQQIEAYAAGGPDGRALVDIMGRSGLPKEVRQIAGKILGQRKDPKMVPVVIDGLYSEDKETRRLAIGVVKSIVGKTFGYSPTASEKKRSDAIRKLNAHLAKDRKRYYR
jgi:hypothetical protein